MHCHTVYIRYRIHAILPLQVTPACTCTSSHLHCQLDVLRYTHVDTTNDQENARMIQIDCAVKPTYDILNGVITDGQIDDDDDT